MNPTFKQVTKTRYVQLVSELAQEIFAQHYTKLTPKVAAALADKYQSDILTDDEIHSGVINYFLIYLGTEPVGYFALDLGPAGAMCLSRLFKGQYVAKNRTQGTAPQRGRNRSFRHACLFRGAMPDGHPHHHGFLGHEQTRRHFKAAPAAYDDNTPMLGYHPHVIFQILIRKHFENHIRPHSTRKRGQRIQIARLRVIQYDMRSDAADKLHRGRAPCGTDYERSTCTRQLYGDGPHTSARAVYEDAFCGLKACTLKKSPIRGHTGKSHRRTLLKRNGIGQEMNSLRITDNLLSISPRIASRRKSRHKNPITGFTALHPLAHLVHNSRAIKPGGIGQYGFEEGILARSDIGFGRIDPRRIQPNTDLPMFRFWFRNVRKAQNLRTAKCRHDNSAHNDTPSVCKLHGHFHRPNHCYLKPLPLRLLY